MDSKFLPRGLAPAVRAALADTPVVCLLGPRQCGKTTLVQTLAPGHGYVTLDDEDALTFARSDPNGFLAALPDPVIIDEIQRAPELLRAIKLSVDRNRRPGRFLLTGSANLLLLPRLGESLAGRMTIVDLQPLTASEQERAPGRFLSTWLAGRLKPTLAASSEPTAALSLAARVIAGGFPEPATRNPARARAWHRDYVRALLERDVNDVARIKEPRDLTRLLSLLALRTGELLNISTLSNELDIQRDTVETTSPPANGSTWCAAYIPGIDMPPSGSSRRLSCTSLTAASPPRSPTSLSRTGTSNGTASATCWKPSSSSN